jgi:hypothetical protein
VLTELAFKSPLKSGFMPSELAVIVKDAAKSNPSNSYFDP